MENRASRIRWFVFTVLVLSYVVAGIYYLLNGGLTGIAGTILAVLYMFLPLLSVVIVEKLVFKGSPARSLLLRFHWNPWLPVAIAIPYLLVLFTIIISLAWPGVTYSPDLSGYLERLEGVLSPEELSATREAMQNPPVHPALMVVIAGLFAGLTVNALAAFGEESAWRGYLIRLSAGKSFLSTALWTGALWGIWHAPLILMGHNYPEHPELGVLMMTLWCIVLTPMFLYVTLKSKTVLAAVFLHGVLNAIAATGLMFIRGGNDLTVGVSGMSGIVAVLIIDLMLFIYDRWISRERIITGSIEPAKFSPEDLVEK